MANTTIKLICIVVVVSPYQKQEKQSEGLKVNDDINVHPTYQNKSSHGRKLVHSMGSNQATSSLNGLSALPLQSTTQSTYMTPRSH